MPTLPTVGLFASLLAIMNCSSGDKSPLEQFHSCKPIPNATAKEHRAKHSQRLAGLSVPKLALVFRLSWFPCEHRTHLRFDFLFVSPHNLPEKGSLRRIAPLSVRTWSEARKSGEDENDINHTGKQSHDKLNLSTNNAH